MKINIFYSVSTLIILLIINACASNQEKVDVYYRDHSHSSKQYDEAIKLENPPVQENTTLDNAFNALDQSYEKYKLAERESLECQEENLYLEDNLIDLLSTDQLELFSKLQKAIKQESLTDTKLNYDKLFEIFDFEQSMAYKDYMETFFICSAITENYQSAKDDFEKKKKALLAYAQALFYDDPGGYNLIKIGIDQKYP